MNRYVCYSFMLFSFRDMYIFCITDYIESETASGIYKFTQICNLSKQNSYEAQNVIGTNTFNVPQIVI